MTDYNKKYSDEAEEILRGDEFRGANTHPVQSIKVIGVGGGGNNAVDHMYNQGIKDVSFVQINTDGPVLQKSNVPCKVLIGPGRGAGGKPEKARKLAEENAEKIAELFDEHTDMVFITAGMGGGTGTGAGPVVARIAKELGILTVGIVTIPFLFEGRRRVLQALDGAKEMEKNVDALLIINNERLNEIYSDLDILNAFARADDTLLNAAQGITEIITNTGIINRDFNDVDSTLREGGTAIISSGEGEGENRVTKAIENALHSPLLRNTDIFGSKKLLMVLYIDTTEGAHFEMSETTQLTDFVNNIDPEVEVMWGLYPKPGLGDKVKITILASGFDVTVDDGVTPAPARPAATKQSKEEMDAIIQEYGPEAVRAINRPGSKVKVLRPEELDSDEAIAQAEATAFTRARRPVTKAATDTARHAAEEKSDKDNKGNDNPEITDSINFNGL